jgi:regulatory protein
MSRRELTDALARGGVDGGDAADAADWLERLGYVNDANYANMVVRKYAGKGYGAARIRDELRRHGISDELRETAMSDAPDAAETAYKFYRARMRAAGARDEGEDAGRRAAQAMRRRGFSWDEITAARNAYIAETEGAD